MDSLDSVQKMLDIVMEKRKKLEALVYKLSECNEGDGICVEYYHLKRKVQNEVFYLDTDFLDIYTKFQKSKRLRYDYDFKEVSKLTVRKLQIEIDNVKELENYIENDLEICIQALSFMGKYK